MFTRGLQLSTVVAVDLVVPFLAVLVSSDTTGKPVLIRSKLAR
jgi:hypothetical protein